MANFYLILDRREQSAKQPELQEFAGAKMMPQKLEGNERFTGQLEDACVVKVSASSTNEFLSFVRHFYPGLAAGRIALVEAANWAEA